MEYVFGFLPGQRQAELLALSGRSGALQLLCMTTLLYII